jgi:hypothetical protein
MVDADPSNALSRTGLANTLRLRGIAMQRCGRPADAVSDFRQSIAVLQGQKELSPRDYYVIACAQSRLSGVAREAGSGLTLAAGRAAADEAMVTLRRAVAAGWREAAWMMADPDLIPIRSRPDFQLLMMDLSFPAEPFSKNTEATR